MANKKVVYMKITQDKYELPEFVCDSVTELSRLCNVSANNIHRQLSLYKSGVIKNCKYRRVEIREDD